jgi:hypothetical protein
MHYARHRALAQLDEVAQQHQVVGIRDRGGQRVEHVLATKQVAPAREPEVEVGDDGGAHRAIFARQWWIQCTATP